MGIGNAIIYLFGLPWLAYFVGAEKVLVAGLFPFIPGDLIKLALAATALPAGWGLIRKLIVDGHTGSVTSSSVG
jgi:biotin transporter BioY